MAMARLSQAPVCFTLAQMRFNPLLDMKPLLPGLQNAFRKAGFPDYEKAQVQDFEVRQDPEGVSVNHRTVERHVFRNKGRTAAILLDTGALTYELTDYPVFSDFSKSFLTALDIVHEHRPIEYCDRLGMRMLDAVQPKAGDSMEKYVISQVLGLTDLSGGMADHHHTSTESLYRIGRCTLLMRTMRVPNGIVAPPDLVPLRLNIRPRFLEHRGDTVMIDGDCFQDERCDFSPVSAEDGLRNLKGYLSSAFKALVTPHALEVWE